MTRQASALSSKVSLLMIKYDLEHSGSGKGSMSIPEAIECAPCLCMLAYGADACLNLPVGMHRRWVSASAMVPWIDRRACQACYWHSTASALTVHCLTVHCLIARVLLCSE